MSNTYSAIAPQDADTFDMKWVTNIGNATISNVVNIVVSREDGVATDLNVVGSPTISGNTTVVYHLSGGTAGHVYTVAMTVITSTGRTLTRDGIVVCKNI